MEKERSHADSKHSESVRGKRAGESKLPPAPTTVSPKSALNETEAACYIGMSPGMAEKISDPPLSRRH